MTPPMNPHQKPQEDVVVTQEDREAAASLAEWHTNVASQWEQVNGGTMQWFTGDFPSAVRRGIWDNHPFTQAFARHRLLGHEAGRRDMREAAGKVCREQQAAFLSPQYATGQPLSSFGERFACGQCAEAIEALPTEPLGGEGKPKP